MFAQQAKAAGVTVKVNNVDPSVFYGNDYLKWTFAQDFWATRNYLPQVQNGTAAERRRATRPTGRTAEWQALINQAFKTVDDTKRNELVAQAEKIEYERGGYIIWALQHLHRRPQQEARRACSKTTGAPTPPARCRYNLMYFA